MFCRRGEFEVLYGGAAGGGKSDALIMEAVRGVGHPRYHGLIVRRTFPQLQEIIDRTFEWYPQVGGHYAANKYRWEWPNGARITLSHIQHEKDKYNFQGKEYAFVGWDELTLFTETQYLYLISRVRRSDSDLGLCFRATTNPGGIGHSWVKRRFIDVAKPFETYIDPVSGTSRIFIPAKVYDNPSIMDNDPGYVRRLEALPELEKLRLLHGVWDVFEGQVFPELGQRTHGCDPFEIPVDWERFMAFDWGYSHPYACLWFAVDFDGVVYCYKELYGSKFEKSDNPDDYDKGLRETNTQICQAIHEAERGERAKIRYRIADPACWSPTQRHKGKDIVFGPSFTEDASREGLHFLKADNDRARGKQQCHQRFAMAEETDHRTGEVIKEYPQFVAFNSLKHFWRTLQELREDEKNPEEVDPKQEDHLFDVLKYSLMSRPVSPKKLASKAPPGSFKAERDRYIRAKQYAQGRGVSIADAYLRVR